MALLLFLICRTERGERVATLLPLLRLFQHFLDISYSGIFEILSYDILRLLILRPRLLRRLTMENRKVMFSFR